MNKLFRSAHKAFPRTRAQQSLAVRDEEDNFEPREIRGDWQVPPTDLPEAPKGYRWATLRNHFLSFPVPFAWQGCGSSLVVNSLRSVGAPVDSESSYLFLDPSKVDDLSKPPLSLDFN